MVPGARSWMVVVMVRWRGLRMLGCFHAGSDGIHVILGGIAPSVGDDAARLAEEWYAEGRFAGTGCGWSCFSEQEESAGPGTACSTMGRLGRAAAVVVVGVLGQCSRAG